MKTNPLTQIDFYKADHRRQYPKGIVSIVSDSFDFWQVVTTFLPKLKQEILARKGGFPVDKVVIRPDSGDPVLIICGDPSAMVDSPQWKGAIECLWDTFGGTINEKGYRQLDPHIGLIYGDSITPERTVEIMERLMHKGFTSTNIVLGVGSYTYTHVTRDTLGFAMKATAGQVNGQLREIFKDPKTDSGLKKSARGYMIVLRDENGDYAMFDRMEPFLQEKSELKEVFRDGKLLQEYSLADVRARVAHHVQRAINK